ncbi:unnamed protein product [Lactuca saligna]|uniref:Hybrid signal transduction histidine kinase M n=1 Tax=Lactuca saligna TaxID=75948 RepID=A0AA36A0C2_LACSI|nr:unnamed protein product [Lactuca saligna]
MQLESDLRSITMGDLSVHDYFTKIKKIASLLEGMGEKVKEKHVVIHAINGLSHKFDNIAGIIRHNKPPPTFDGAWSILLIEEQKITTNQATDHAHADADLLSYHLLPPTDSNANHLLPPTDSNANHLLSSPNTSSYRRPPPPIVDSHNTVAPSSTSYTHTFHTTSYITPTSMKSSPTTELRPPTPSSDIASFALESAAIANTGLRSPLLVRYEVAKITPYL